LAHFAIYCTTPAARSPPLEEELEDELELELLLELTPTPELEEELELDELEEELEELEEELVPGFENQDFIKAAVCSAQAPVHLGASLAATGGIEAAMVDLATTFASLIG
jgi:hypothetical protein